MVAAASVCPPDSASEDVQRVWYRVSKDRDIVVGGNAYQVISEQLHDESGVLVALLAEGIEFCTNVSLVSLNASSYLIYQQ